MVSVFLWALWTTGKIYHTSLFLYESNQAMTGCYFSFITHNLRLFIALCLYNVINCNQMCTAFSPLFPKLLFSRLILTAHYRHQLSTCGIACNRERNVHNITSKLEWNIGKTLQCTFNGHKRDFLFSPQRLCWAERRKIIGIYFIYQLDFISNTAPIKSSNKC